MRVGCCRAHLVIDCRHDGSPSPPMVSADRKHDTTLTTYLLLLLAAQLTTLEKQIGLLLLLITFKKSY